MDVSSLTDEDLDWAECVFISGMAAQRRSANEVIARCKARGVRIVAGGPLFTCEHEQFDQVDHLVLNEAELTLSGFLHDLERGSPQHVYSTTGFADLRETPVPLWELVNLKDYHQITVQFGRGCPFNCEFCNIASLLGHRVRVKTGGQIIAELERAYQLGYRGNVMFADDNIIGNRKALEQDLLPKLIEWRKTRPGINFQTEASIDMADDPQLMQMLVRAGFERIGVGIESLNAECLSECGKHQNKNRDTLADVRRITQAGLVVQGGFIVGFDHDDAGVFQQLTDFIQESGIVAVAVGLLQAIPGTRLYERMKREGRLENTWGGNWVEGTINFATRMDPDVLHAGYRNMLKDIYSPRNHYLRAKTFLRAYKQPPEFRIRSEESGRLTAFVRALVRLGIMDRGRVYFWRLLFWTAITRRELLPLAVSMAIQGYHFRKVIEERVS